MSVDRIPTLKAYRYDVTEPARCLAIHCVDLLRKRVQTDKGREDEANAVLHTAVLAEMCAFKGQLDAAVVAVLADAMKRMVRSGAPE